MLFFMQAHILVVSTQRLAMVFRQSADFQCNEKPAQFGCMVLNYDLFVIAQPVKKILRWYNFQIAGKGRVSLHLFASLVRRFEVYDGKFLRKPFEPDDTLKKGRYFVAQSFFDKAACRGNKNN